MSEATAATGDGGRPLLGQWAVVTGGSMGIGRAVAERFVQGGANVVLVARGREALDDAVESTRALATPGQDVTGIEDPLASYGRFIDRVVTEYDNLSVVFQFVKVDAGEAVYRQHTRVRELVEKAERRPWLTFSEEAVQEWLIKSNTLGA